VRLVLSSFFAALLLVLGGCSPAAQKPDHGPLVLAASSLQEAMEAAAGEWAADGHAKPVLSFAASSALARQIEAGAGADLFVSADEKWMDEVERRGLVVPGTRASFLRNSLVLVAPAGKAAPVDVAPGFDLAGRLGNGRLAMADPDAVPAGIYGKEALTSLGAWDAVSGKVASAENVRAALALVSRGEAPLGIVYATDALAEPGVQVVGRFPGSSHKPIVYPAARLKSSTNPDAEGFRQFLVSDKGKAVFRRFGFGTDPAG